MFLGTNLKFLRKRRGRTQVDVAEKIGLKRPTYNGYENNVAEPSIDILINLSKYFNIAVDTMVKIDLRQLGELQLRELESGNDIFIKGSKIRILATTVNKDNVENIELVSEKAKAGYANGFADPEFIKTLPAFQLPFLSKNKKYRTFQLKGDSMLPIPDGAWVTGEFVQDWKTIISGHAYIIFTLDEGIVFKIVENQIEKKGILTLYSLNPMYDPYEVVVPEIKEIWRFVNYISKELPDPILPKDELIKTVASLKHDVDRLKARTKS